MTKCIIEVATRFSFMDHDNFQTWQQCSGVCGSSDHKNLHSSSRKPASCDSNSDISAFTHQFIVEATKDKLLSCVTTSDTSSPSKKCRIESDVFTASTYDDKSSNAGSHRLCGDEHYSTMSISEFWRERFERELSRFSNVIERSEAFNSKLRYEAGKVYPLKSLLREETQSQAQLLDKSEFFSPPLGYGSSGTFSKLSISEFWGDRFEHELSRFSNVIEGSESFNSNLRDEAGKVYPLKSSLREETQSHAQPLDKSEVFSPPLIFKAKRKKRRRPPSHYYGVCSSIAGREMTKKKIAPAIQLKTPAVTCSSTFSNACNLFTPIFFSVPHSLGVPLPASMTPQPPFLVPLPFSHRISPSIIRRPVSMGR